MSDDGKEKYILALDTAMAACSVALYVVQADVIGAGAARQVPMVRGHAEALVPMVQDMMQERGVEFSALTAVVTTVGPGAFTGLRIGLSTARALGLALDIPVYGLKTLDILAASFFEKKELVPENRLAVILETKRSDFYVGLYGADGRALMEAAALTAEALAEKLAGIPAVLIGDAATRFAEGLPEETGFSYEIVPGYDVPDPTMMAALAARGQGFLSPEPVYLRGADVSTPKRAGRVLCSG